MNKTLSLILWLLLALAGIAVIFLTSQQIVFAFLSKEYGRAVLQLALDLLCAYLSGTAIARLIKMRKKS